MTAARRGQKRAFPPAAPSTVAKVPPGGVVRPTLSRASTIPASTPSVPPAIARGKVSPIRLEAARSPPTRVSSGALEGIEGSQMEWIIESYDRRTDRDFQNRFTSESAFLSAAEELLRNTWKGFVSATLPDGKVLDEAAMRALVARTSVNP
jgi:hypothetical protein